MFFTKTEQQSKSKLLYKLNLTKLDHCVYLSLKTPLRGQDDYIMYDCMYVQA